MIEKFKKSLPFLGILVLFLATSPLVLAQEIRPTPTMAPAQETPRPTETPVPPTPVPPTATPLPQDNPATTGLRGSIQGTVFEDVDGDGSCVNTDREGENPVEGVAIEFVSSDEQTTINLTSGPDGKFGLFAAGQSYWAVSVKPDAQWIVTSQRTQFAPVYEGSLNIVGINFCLQKASATQVLLPASGAIGFSPILTAMGLLGMLLILTGLGLQLRKIG